jgi:ATP-dependent DNA helicase HFM1/MER3
LCISSAKFLDRNCQRELGKVAQNQSSGLNFKDRELGRLVRSGISYHHAGLEYNDRKNVESLFLNGITKIICSTSTLAMGVNLPAHMVIIKGTQTWAASSFKEYNESELLQMLGRAGR